MALNLATNASFTWFFSISDVGSSNFILPALLADIGLKAGTKLTYRAFAFDNYFTDALTDACGPRW